MRRTKKILLVMFLVFIVIQFIRPDRNESSEVLQADISKMVAVPDSVQLVLKNACYDCHSNNTHYPWYVNIQPIAWLMNHHIQQGKSVLNFSEFGSYSLRRQISKLKGIENSIKDDIMPLSSYKMMHKNAQLNQYQKALIINWVQHSKDSLSTKE